VNDRACREIAETGTWRLSPDGKTLTVTTKGKIGDQEYSNLPLLERAEN
jgi:hypothetical protein